MCFPLLGGLDDNIRASDSNTPALVPAKHRLASTLEKRKSIGNLGGRTAEGVARRDEG